MARVWEMAVAGVPRTKARHRSGRSGRGPDAGRHAYTPDTTVDYERRVAGVAINAGVAICEGRCDLDVRVWLPDRRRKDLDNVLKVVMDGLVRGGRLLLHDDSFVHVRSVRCWHAGYDAANPRVEIRITEVADDDQPLPAAWP